MSHEGSPAILSPRHTRPAWASGPDPIAHMRMACRPYQHRTGDAEIVVPPGQAGVDNPGIAHLGLELVELLEGKFALLVVDQPNLICLQLGVIEFDQMRAADCVNEHR